MRGFRLLAIVIAVFLPCSAVAQVRDLHPADYQVRVRIHPFTTVQLETLSNVAVTSSAEAIESKRRGSYACVSFVNNDPRIATAITFHFVYFDNLGNRAGENELVRSGRFSQGTYIESTNVNTGLGNLAECANVPYHDRNLTADLIYVKSVTYLDGTIWNAAGVVVPQHLPVGKAQ
jgi:hypothetical protein